MVGLVHACARSAQTPGGQVKAAKSTPAQVWLYSPPERGEQQNGLWHRHRNIQRFLEAGAARGGTRVHPRLVLRHADDHRRLLRCNGRRGNENLAHPAGHRRAGAVQPHRSRDGERVRNTQRHGARTHRFRCRYRFLRTPRHGSRCNEACRHGGIYPRRLRPAEWRDAGDEHRGQAQEDPLSQPGFRPDQHARSDPPARLRLRPEVPGADSEAECRLEKFYLGRSRCDVRVGKHAAKLAISRSQSRRPVCHRVGLRLRPARR